MFRISCECLICLFAHVSVYVLPQVCQVSFCGVMANDMDLGQKVNEFKLQLCYYIDFQTEERLEPLIPQLWV